MKQFPFIGLAISGILLSGCSVMHFKNGNVAAGGPKQEQWHHNAAFSLMEVSKPVDLQTSCNGKGWSQVTTEETFVTGLAGAIDAVIFVDLWDPQALILDCAEGGATPAAASNPSPETAKTATPKKGNAP